MQITYRNNGKEIYQFSKILTLFIYGLSMLKSVYDSISTIGFVLPKIENPFFLDSSSTFSKLTNIYNTVWRVHS